MWSKIINSAPGWFESTWDMYLHVFIYLTHFPQRSCHVNFTDESRVRWTGSQMSGIQYSPQLLKLSCSYILKKKSFTHIKSIFVCFLLNFIVFDQLYPICISKNHYWMLIITGHGTQCGLKKTNTYTLSTKALRTF